MTTLYENETAGRQCEATGPEQRLSALEKDVAKLFGRSDDMQNGLAKILGDMQKELKSLRGLRLLIVASKSPPFERGGMYFAPGDPIPSHSNGDYLDGKPYRFGDDSNPFALVVTKNRSGRTLKAGDAYGDGIVDTKLRHECHPNNFCYIEV